jgi:hypothetical protein
MIQHLLRQWSVAALHDHGYRCLDNESYTGIVALMEGYGSGFPDPRRLPIEMTFERDLPEIHFTADIAAVMPHRGRAVTTALRDTRGAFPSIVFAVCAGWVRASLWLSLWDDTRACVDECVVIGRTLDTFYYALCCAHEQLDQARVLHAGYATTVCSQAETMVRGEPEQ